MLRIFVTSLAPVADGVLSCRVFVVVVVARRSGWRASWWARRNMAGGAILGRDQD